jgi:hypothetical protein
VTTPSTDLHDDSRPDEPEIDPGDGDAVPAHDLLAHGSRQPGCSDQAEEAAFEVALAAGVDHEFVE